MKNQKLDLTIKESKKEKDQMPTNINSESISRKDSSSIFDVQKRRKSINKTMTEEVASLIHLPGLKVYQPLGGHTLQHSPESRSNHPLRSYSKGAEVLTVMNQQRVADFQVQLMENRLQKLQMEEERNVKKIQQTIERTKQYERNMELKEKQRQGWNEHKMYQQEQIEEFKQKLFKTKDDRYRRVREHFEVNLERKRNYKDELNGSLKMKWMSVQQSIDNELDNKRVNSQTIKNERDQGIQERKESKAGYELEVARQYQVKKRKAEHRIEVNRNKILDMEQKEQELINKLQTTQKIKDELGANFKKMSTQKRNREVRNSPGSISYVSLTANE